MAQATPDSPRRTSELLEEIRTSEGGERIDLGEIVDGTEGRAHGLILLILSLPETIPMIGLSAILAAPILVLGVIMAIRGDDPPIPNWVRDRSVPRDHLQGAIRRTLPAMRWMEKFSKPRWSGIASSGRLQGLVCVLMAVILAIPIPGLNLLAAAAVAGTGLGILQRDGLVIAVATALSLAAVAGFFAVISGAWALLT